MVAGLESVPAVVRRGQSSSPSQFTHTNRFRVNNKTCTWTGIEQYDLPAVRLIEEANYVSRCAPPSVCNVNSGPLTFTTLLRTLRCFLILPWFPVGIGNLLSTYFWNQMKRICWCSFFFSLKFHTKLSVHSAVLREQRSDQWLRSAIMNKCGAERMWRDAARQEVSGAPAYVTGVAPKMSNAAERPLG